MSGAIVKRDRSDPGIGARSAALFGTPAFAATRMKHPLRDEGFGAGFAQYLGEPLPRANPQGGPRPSTRFVSSHMDEEPV